MCGNTFGISGQNFAPLSIKLNV